MAIFRDGAFGNTVDTTGWAIPHTGDSSFLNPKNYTLLGEGTVLPNGVVPSNTNPVVTTGGTLPAQSFGSGNMKYLALGAAGLALFFFLKK